MEKWYGNSWSYVVKELESDTNKGLSSLEIESRENEYGENIISVEKKRVGFLDYIKFFANLHIIIQIILATLYILDRKFFQAIALIVTILFYFAFEHYNHMRKKNKSKQIERLNAGKARCIRDRHMQSIDISGIVVGDIIMIGEGETVPADIRLVESEDLKVRENSVTGKDEIVDKYETRIYGEVENLWELNNILFKSSVVVKGQCTGIVVAVGADTQIGKIVTSTNMREDRDELTVSVKNIVKRFMNFALGAILISALLSWGLHRNVSDVYEFIKLSLYSIYVNVTIVSLMVFYFCLKRTMKEKGIDFFNIFSMQKIAGIETIIANDRELICEEEMIVRELFSDGMHLNELSEEQFSEYNIERMMQIALLCNTVNAANADGMIEKESHVGALADVGIVNFAHSIGLSKKHIEKMNPRIFQIQMDSERMIMTTLNKVEEYYRANIKGESEEILKRCTYIMKNGLEVEITQSDIETIRSKIIEMSNRALKVIGLAYRNFNYEPSTDENIESHLVFVGLIALENTIKDSSIETLEECEKLNIKTLLMTQNNKLYAYALGKKLGIIKNIEETLSGIEFKYMDEEEQIRITDKIKVFSNIFIEHKVKLIKYLSNKDEITAICINNFNDLPAFNETDIGIAYGKRCSNTIRSISDVFVSHNSFHNIITFIKNCRLNLINLNVALYYFISVSFSQIALIILQELYLSNMNIDYVVISVINLVCTPLNIIFILLKQKYNNETIDNYHGSKLTLRFELKTVIICCIPILILLIMGILICSKLNFINNIISNIIITALIFSYSQFIIKRTFQKYEIDN